MQFPRVDGYEIEECLGQGGMGTVYRARDLRTGSRVALKILHRSDATAIFRLKREFRSLADIVHPNLVRLDELHCSDEQWFFTMELVPGRSFLQHLGVELCRPPRGGTPAQAGDDTTVLRTDRERPTTRSSLDETRVRALFSQLVQGVAAIHRAGKLHCDIKPSNLLVTPEGRVVVLDFGVISAFVADDPFYTVDEHVAGTPEYMSPEQAAGKTIGPASDWYAVGVVLYETLSGTLPFSGPRLSIMTDKQSLVPARPSLVRPGLPAELEALCMDLLALRPADRPDAQDILRRLGVGPQSEPPRAPDATSPPRAQLWGRQAELAQLMAAWRDVGPNRSVLALVVGDSGIGKTTLLTHCLERVAAEPNTLVLRGRCYERESVPYKAFDPIVDELSRFLRHLTDREVAELLPRDVRALSRVFPILRRVQAVADARGREADGSDEIVIHRRAFLAFKELLTRLSDRYRVVIGIDDLQWSDADSVRLLLEVLDPADTPGVFVLGGTRAQGAEHSGVLGELTEEPSLNQLDNPIRRIDLQPLAAEQALQLAASLLDASDAEGAAAEIARESGGNPFFVHELVRYVHRSRGTATLRIPAHEGHVDLDDVLRARIAPLPDDARQLLELIAVAGRPVPQATLLRIAGVPRPDEAAWRALTDARAIRMHGAPGAFSVECYHDRVRHAVASRLAPERIAELHRVLAHAIEEEGRSDPEALFEHYRGAGDTHRAREHAVTSANAAARGLAFARAARLYRFALELAPSSEQSRIQLQRELAQALANAGRTREAAEAYQEAAQRVHGLDAVELKRLSAQHYLTSGHTEPGVRMLKEALGDVGLDYPSSSHNTIGRLLWERAKIRARGLRFRERSVESLAPRDLARIDVCFSAAVGLGMSDPARAAAFSAQQLNLALSQGEPQRIARGIAFEMGIAPAAGAEGMRWALRALPVAERLSQRYGNAYHRGLFFLAQAHVAYLNGQWQPAIEWSKSAENLLRSCQGAEVQWALLSCNVMASISTVVSGDLVSAAQRLPSFVKEARQRGDLHSVALMTYPRVLVELAHDRAELARSLAEEAACCRGHEGFHLRDFTGLHSALLVDRYVGDAPAAWRRVSQAWPNLERSKLLVVNIMRMSAHAERASAALGVASAAASDPGLKIAKECIELLSKERLLHARAMASLLQARVLYMEGDASATIALLTDAIRELDGAGMSLHAKCARRCVGVLMGGDIGKQFVLEADEALAAQGIKSSQRFADMMVPGFALARRD